MKYFTSLFFFTLLFAQATVYGQFYQYNNPAIEREIDTIVSKMTLQEKLALLGGYKNGRIRALPKLNLPELKTAPFYFYPKNEEAISDYPSNLNLGAAWDTTLMLRLGKLTAQTAKANKIALLYGPNLNLYRSPADWDNAEHFSEDPFLTGRLASYLIKGIQNQKVMSAPTGFAADYLRFSQQDLSVVADERTMEELYLAPYRTAVMQGKAAGMVAGKTLIAGEKLTESTTYLTDILKGEFLFEGIVLADSGAVFQGPLAAKAGLDLELPTTFHFRADSLEAHLKAQKIAEGLIDDKVKRLLRMQKHFGYIEKKTTAGTAPNSMDKEQLNADIARGSIVLLKNQKEFLPLQKTQLKSLAIIGPYAKKIVGIDNQKPKGKLISGETNIATGIKYFLDNTTTCHVQKGLEIYEDALRKNDYFTDLSFKDKGLQATFFANANLEGNAVFVSKENVLSFSKERVINDNSPVSAVSVRMEGVFEPENSGIYEWFAVAEDGIRVYINDALIIDEWKEQPLRELAAKFTVEEGESYMVKIEYFHHLGKMKLRTGYIENPESAFDAAIDVAKNAEVALVCVGYDAETERKGHFFSLPKEQERLLKEVIKVNKNVVVVLTGGSAIDMSAWKDSVKAILHTFYPGSKGGAALTDILFGRVSPSGRLPFSWENKPIDNPTFHPEKISDFSEKWKMGYRYYVTEQDVLQPLYPFGYGLSYSTFDYRNITIEPNNFTGNGGKIKISFDVVNLGQREAADVPQLYLRDTQSSQPRPPRELKAFAKVLLKPGETSRVSLYLTQEELSFYHPEKHAWVTENGVFEAQIGHNVNDITLKAPFTYSGEKTYNKKRRKRK